MTGRPLLLTGPYLAMWLWLIVPFTLHGLVPLGALPSWTINLDLGAWLEEVNHAVSVGHAFQIMRQERHYELCRYVRADTHRVSLVAVRPNGQHCKLLRLSRPDKGSVVRSASYAAIFDTLIEINK